MREYLSKNTLWVKIIALLLAWGTANWLAILGIDRYERADLEAEHDLRVGILSEFAAPRVDCELPSAQPIQRAIVSLP